MTCGNADTGAVPRGTRRTAWAQATAFAAALGVANELAVDRVRTGFEIGTGDHIVLAPLGLHWADPAAFAGDWFMTAAPQPHWSFDLLIALGARTGTLAALLTAYYLAALLAFGAATSVLARAWVPRLAWPAGLGYAVLASFQGVSLFGTNSPFMPLAVPNILGAQLAYLFLAGLLTRRRWAGLVLPFVVVAHLQIGLLCLGVAVLAAGSALVGLDPGAPRRPGPWVAAPIAAAAALAAFGLWLRPVASDPRSFAEICRTVITYHCAAGQWPPPQVVSSVAGAFLAVVAAALVPRGDRRPYLVIMVLVGGALVAALVADRARVPLLGTLVEGFNVYRAGVLIVPFAVWGALVPVLRQPRGAPGWALAGAATLAGIALLSGPRAKVGIVDPDGARPVGVAIAVVAFAAAVGWLARRGRTRRTVSAALAVLCALGMGGALASGYALAGFALPRWIPDPDARAWGEQARRVIPPGTQVLIPPNGLAYRLPMERGVVADCKEIPYGGSAYAQWRERMAALGGVEQCVTGRGGFFALSAGALDRAAAAYGADAVLLPAQGDDRQVNGLVALGYRAQPVQAGAYDTLVLRRASVGG